MRQRPTRASGPLGRAGQIHQALVLGLSLGVCGCATELGEPRSAGPPRSIVIVSIDTLRPDHLGCYGYFRPTSPAIDQLATESVLFERAMAPMSMTLPSHTSLFTATYPLEHGVLANIEDGGRQFVPAPGIRSFAEHARDRGFQTAAFVSAAPLAASTGIAAGFDVFDEPAEHSRPAEETNAEVFRWINEELRPGPFLLFVHYFDPHFPYQPPEDFRGYSGSESLNRYLGERRIPRFVESPWGSTYATPQSTNLYDGEVRYTDEQVGRLIDRLRRAGRWDATAVVLISDHGESIGDHSLLGHEYVTREQLQSLLMLRVPGYTPQRVQNPVSLVDTLPTLIGMLGDDAWREFLDQVSGRDVLAPATTPQAVLAQRAEKTRRDFIGPAFSLLSGNWHYVYEPEKKNQLFDWSTDPFELRNVIKQHADVAASLETELLERVRSYHARGVELRGDADALADMDPDLVRKLRLLGYVEAP